MALFKSKKYSYTDLLAIRNNKKAEKEFLARADGGDRVELFLEMFKHERQFKTYTLNLDPSTMDEGGKLIHSVFANDDVGASISLLAQINKVTGKNLLVDIVYSKFATDYYMYR